MEKLRLCLVTTKRIFQHFHHSAKASRRKDPRRLGQNYKRVTSFRGHNVLITERKPNGNKPVDGNTANVESSGGGGVNPQYLYNVE